MSGIAGHVIVSYWENFKTSSQYDSDIIQSPKFQENPWENFNLSCIKKLDGGREQILNTSTKNYDKGTKEDWVNVVYALENSKKYQIDGVSLPSFIDYVTFFTAVVEVVKAFGENPQKIMNHARTKKIFTDIMQNNRDFLFPLMLIIQGENNNTHDEYRVFQPKFFEITQDKNGKKYIKIKENLISGYKTTVKDFLDTPGETEEINTEVYGCPVLHAPKLATEIYDWLYQEMLKIK